MYLQLLKTIQVLHGLNILPDDAELQVWVKKERSFPEQEFAHTNPIARLGSNTQPVANFTFTYSI